MPLPLTAQPKFQDRQIIYLQHGTVRLYAETIQIIQPRQLCWARPLALTHLQDELGVNFHQPLILHDLRQGSDLILPLSLFHIALDIDAMPIMTQLNAPEDRFSTESSANNSQVSPSLLQNFVHQVWQAYPEHFLTNPLRDRTDLQARN